MKQEGEACAAGRIVISRGYVFGGRVDLLPIFSRLHLTPPATQAIVGVVTKEMLRAWYGSRVSDAVLIAILSWKWLPHLPSIICQQQRSLWHHCTVCRLHFRSKPLRILLFLLLPSWLRPHTFSSLPRSRLIVYSLVLLFLYCPP